MLLPHIVNPFMMGSSVWGDKLDAVLTPSVNNDQQALHGIHPKGDELFLCGIGVTKMQCKIIGKTATASAKSKPYWGD